VAASCDIVSCHKHANLVWFGRFGQLVVWQIAPWLQTAVLCHAASALRKVCEQFCVRFSSSPHCKNCAIKSNNRRSQSTWAVAKVEQTTISPLCRLCNPSIFVFFAFGLSAKLMPKALELLFFDNFLTTF
jgi:hypothetical protein